jgi:hypothetical protein
LRIDFPLRHLFTAAVGRYLMVVSVGGVFARAVAGAATWNGAVAQSLSPASVLEASPAVQAAGSFVTVMIAGGVVLYWSERFVDRSVDAIVDRPSIAVLYGLVAYFIVLAVGLYAVSQSARLPVGGATVARVGAVALTGVLIVLTGAGFLVVGTLLLEVTGRRDPAFGLLLGAVLSALGWLALPPIGGAAVCVLVGAFGIGGAARIWFQSEYAVKESSAG